LSKQCLLEHRARGKSQPKEATDLALPREIPAMESTILSYKITDNNFKNLLIRVE
jgi:hypothetical protein